ncbi:hypothetical protein C1645_804539 [Glomus cerebriforme]|uniref:F-box domain-containing protein n=1 Tax=Glomus cerebriforme TaxID=658196 RepID=A0A397T397_9GLOM|nr:hypothetical protein C1645_804539 [Glomus cerebriforme]
MQRSVNPFKQMERKSDYLRNALSLCTPNNEREDYKSNKIHRCVTKVVENLPAEILIQIFSLVIPIGHMRIWGDREDSELEDFILSVEIERVLLRLTCKKWNTIIINLINEAYIDINKIKQCKLEYIIPPPRIRKLGLFDTRFTYVNNNCDPFVLLNSRNRYVRNNGDSGINEWLLENDLTRVESLYLRGCVDLTLNGLSRFNEQLTELNIINCPKITDESLASIFKDLKNLRSLTINTDSYFSDSILYESINEFLPLLNKLSVLIPCKCMEIKTDRAIMIQSINLSKLPKKISNLKISQDLPGYNSHILYFLSSEFQDPPPTLKRLDVSQCFFMKDIFVLPPAITHLTVSYPSVPKNYKSIKLPETLVYLNVSGYVRHMSYDYESTLIYRVYSDRWIDMLPVVAPSLQTLILHLYASPKKLFQTISSRYSDTIQHLDCRILLSKMIDKCVCENACHLGRCFQLAAIRTLKNLKELKFHNRLDEKEIENFPTSLKKLWLIHGYSKSMIDCALERGISLYELEPRF